MNIRPRADLLGLMQLPIWQLRGLTDGQASAMQTGETAITKLAGPDSSLRPSATIKPSLPHWLPESRKVPVPDRQLKTGSTVLHTSGMEERLSSSVPDVPDILAAEMSSAPAGVTAGQSISLIPEVIVSGSAQADNMPGSSISGMIPASGIVPQLYGAGGPYQLEWCTRKDAIILAAFDSTETPEQLELWEKIKQGLSMVALPVLAWPSPSDTDSLTAHEFEAFLSGLLLRLASSQSSCRLFHLGQLPFHWQGSESVALPSLSAMLDDRGAKKHFISLLDNTACL